MRTVIGLFDEINAAQRVVEELDRAGFERDRISIMANTGQTEAFRDTGVETRDVHHDNTAAATGAAIGGIGGGVLGLLVGMGTLAIPGIGPVLAAGPLAAALGGAAIGAVTGGVLGALVDMGVPEEDASYYAEGIRRGGTLVAVQTADNAVERAVDIMNRHGAVDIERRAAMWREQGWAGYDANAEPYNQDQLMQERERYRTTGQHGQVSHQGGTMQGPVRVYGGDPNRR